MYFHRVAFFVNVSVVCVGSPDIQVWEQQTSNGAHPKKKEKKEKRGNKDNNEYIA